MEDRRNEGWVYGIFCCFDLILGRMDWILRLEKENIEDKVRLSCERLLRNIILNYALKIYRAETE